MPDITMCLADNCDRYIMCYRSQAKPYKVQSYSDFSTYCNKRSDFCEYIPMENHKCKKLEEE